MESQKEAPPVATTSQSESGITSAPDSTSATGRHKAKAGGTPRTRTSAAFKSFVAGAVVLLLLLIFILENTSQVKVSYFGVTGHLGLGVALLLAAVGGALLVAILGAARISQLRLYAKRQQRGKA